MRLGGWGRLRLGLPARRGPTVGLRLGEAGESSWIIWQKVHLRGALLILRLWPDFLILRTSCWMGVLAS